MRRKAIFILLPVIILAGFHVSQALINTMLELGLTNAKEQILRPKIPHNNDVYDFILVGGGTAGCVLAGRLSENPNWHVALIEAGGVENIINLVPALAGYLQITHANWNYKSVPQKRACFAMHNNECSQPRGKNLGGSSSINFMIYNRGNRRDFDGWAQNGNYGWAYKDVLPYFLKSESASLDGLDNTEYHNHSGPLGVEHIQMHTLIKLLQ